MIRKIIQIDEDLCTGCGECIPKCAEKALQIVDTPKGKKARLVKEIYCDGLGACLVTCPMDAITIVEREADPFDEEATHQYIKHLEPEQKVSLSCPSSQMLQLEEQEENSSESIRIRSELRQWPVQLHLIPPSAPYLVNADIIFIADCVPFAFPNLHQDLIKGKIVIVSCPQQDDPQIYTAKIAQILKTAHPRKIIVAHMTVPCCFGLKLMIEDAIKEAGIDTTIEEIIITMKGKIV
ncbi:MAG: ATP-binding protein [Candidatus Helarchaeota archaeon]